MGHSHSKSQVPEEILGELHGRTTYTDEQIQKWYNVFLKRGSEVITREDFIFENLGFTRFADEAFWGNIFDILDENHSGTINFSEWVVTLSSLSTSHIDKKLDWIFDSIDINKDGFLSIEEVEKVVNSLNRFYSVGHAKVSTQEIFATLDTHKTGKIMRQEFQEGLSKNIHLIKSLDLSYIVSESLKHLTHPPLPKLQPPTTS
eukprot:TRINITY_DN220_c0_g1_i1.p1 TRINITY_DN220_c0_g1~~TRINITY_DN220_c0_g1_i1.p1  ORF type:complete len:203 (+),score=32.78 TRINITY_DN220_c0_g1_i1:1089-1697(+)